MKILLLVLAVIASASAAKISYRGYKLFNVAPQTEENVELLRELETEGAKTGVMFWKQGRVGRKADLIVPPSAVVWVSQALREAKMRFNVTVEDVEDLLEKEASDNRLAHMKMSRQRSGQTYKSVLGTYARHSAINDWLENVANSYSSIASTENIGSTYEGRTMKLIKIGSDGSNKPAIWLDAGIHAREWIAPAVAEYIIDQLTSRYASNSNIRKMVDDFDWYILPVANPDGYEYTHTNDRMWRKTRAPTNDYYCTGSDPNRNFDFHFGEAGTSSDPCSDTYPGPRPFSEKNTSNMRDKINALKSRLKMYLSLHAYSELWLTPWGYDSARPADYIEMDRVADIGVNALKAVHGKSFQRGTPPAILYAASGGSYDWAKGVADVKYSYTLELRPGNDCSWFCNGFVLDSSQIIPSGEEIFAAVEAVVNAMQ
ncbi:unnamed protein product [Owenia fusiformis]|uniref:Peptidase M14 domain-containing protein n=1 Tax=Owenia fusiformis TaxID=6347 RepID=A0A8J1TSF6_OWEFU|nr:unnamed protein product [Owenia fusiformis]